MMFDTRPKLTQRHTVCAARWLSYVFALISCLNKATLVANTVAMDPFIQVRLRLSIALLIGCQYDLRERCRLTSCLSKTRPRFFGTHEHLGLFMPHRPCVTCNNVCAACDQH